MSAGAVETVTLGLGTPRPREVLVAPFGWYSRYRLRQYLEHTLLVTVALLAIGLTIDLSKFSKILAQNPDAVGIWAVIHVTWYLALRATDILTELLPVACFLGLFSAEVAHTRSRERLMIWNSGRSPSQCLAPIILFGICMGGIQLTLDLYVRPAAVMTQIASHLGIYGEIYDRKAPRDIWIATQNDVIYATAKFGPPPILRDLTIYRLGANRRLQAVITARTAIPTGEQGEWIMQEGSRWEAAADELDRSDFLQRPWSPSSSDNAVDFREEKLALNIAPLWLANYGIPPRNLPHATLRSIANLTNGFPNSGPSINEYQTWVQFRYARSFFTAALILFTGGISFLFMTYRINFEGLMSVVMAGYIVHVAFKVFLVLGEYGYLGPVVASWSIPIFLLIITAIMLLIPQRQKIIH